MAGAVLPPARTPCRLSPTGPAFAGTPAAAATAALAGGTAAPAGALVPRSARCPLRRRAPDPAARGRLRTAAPAAPPPYQQQQRQPKQQEPRWRACAPDAALASSGTDAAAEVGATSRFAVGDAVRVSTSVVMYHMPGAKNEPTDVVGKTGVVTKVISTVNNIRITATKPVVVKFDNMKVSGHFEDDELEPA